MKKITAMICICILFTSQSACANREKGDPDFSSSIASEEKAPDIANDISGEETETTDTKLSALDNKKIGWGMGHELDKENRPIASIDFQDKYGTYDAEFIKENNNTVYLTFDEGYEYGFTPQILDTLKEKDVSAVFFFTYQYAVKNPDLIQRMIDEGHVLGNHTCTHPSLPDISIEKCQEEIEKLDTYIQKNYQYKMNLIRPPKGEFSKRTLAITQNLNYKTIFWSFAYEDWDPENQPDEAASLKRIVDRAHNGAIYLLHATSQTNTKVLGDAIDQIRAKGFTFGIYK